MARTKAKTTSIRDDDGDIGKDRTGNRRTDDDTVSLSGKGAAGDKVEIFDGKNSIGFATVKDNGTWMFNTVELSDGNHSFQTRTHFDQGGVSKKIGRYKIRVDTKINEIDDFSLQANKKAISGELEDQQVRVVGRGEKFATIDIYDNGIKIGTTTANKKGRFVFNLDQGQSSGEHNISLVQQDLAGNISDQGKAKSFSIAGETAPGTAPTVDHVITSSDSFTLTGQASLQAGDTLTIEVNGSTYSSSNGVVIDGDHWSLTVSDVTWPAGNYEVSAIISNSAGSISDTSKNELTITSSSSLGQAGIDTDGDEVNDDIDIDDDNDGILDIVEGDGDDDFDGIANYLDLDSDGDGIADNIEAQSSNGFVESRPGMDADFDGLNDAYDADSTSSDAGKSKGLNPENSDTDAIADYLDKDSDGDGILDVTESGITFRDISEEYFDVTGGIFPSDLADTFGSDERDYREFNFSIGSPVGPVSDIDLQANEISRDVAIGTSVGIIAEARDPNTTDSVTYSLDNNAGGRFSIDANSGIVTTLLDLSSSTAASYTIGITAHSTDGSNSNNDFTIKLIDINQPIGPVIDTDSSLNQIIESAAVGSSVGLIALAIDPDAKDNVQYKLTNDAGGLFAIDETSGAVRVSGTLDHKVADKHDIEVTATSTDGSESSAIFSINVLDDNPPIGPVIDVDANENKVSETTKIGSLVHITANAIDPDSDDVVSYSLFDNAGGRFTIDENSGVVTLAKQLDYSTATSHDIIVKASSSDGTVNVETFKVLVTENTPIGPIFDTNESENEVSECAAPGSSVGITVLALDPDTNGTVNYKLIDNAGDRFTIDQNTGEVTTLASLDYETNDHHNITVEATSPDGTTSTETMRINVIDEEISITLSGIPTSIDQGTQSNYLTISGTTNAAAGTEITIRQNAEHWRQYGVHSKPTYDYKAIVQEDGSFKLENVSLLVSANNPHRLQNGQIYYPNERVSASFTAFMGDEPVHGNTECSATSATSTVSIHNTKVITPLIIDLDGDGVETIAVEQGVGFDIDADGNLDQTAWVAADDGLLVFDRNGDGQINDGSELFGQATAKADGTTANDGFDALRDLDSDGNGVFDSADNDFSNVQVWQDKNSDGKAQEDELLNLEDIGLESINLNAEVINELNQGSIAGLRSSWTDSSGQDHNIDDIWFQFYEGVNDETSEQLVSSALLNDEQEGKIDELLSTLETGTQLHSIEPNSDAQAEACNEDVAYTDLMIQDFQEHSLMLHSADSFFA